MSAQPLTDTARMLVADDKGRLAMDESNPTCNKRFAVPGTMFLASGQTAELASARLNAMS